PGWGGGVGRGPGAAPLLDSGALVELALPQPFPDSPCCVSWSEQRASPALAWLLEYLGDAETLNHEWLSEKAA
ncbi:MAG: LysR family transcriptional regulator, partial [Pantoea dispersa]|nr:LysR family transcriptional regulator [Pantoea dispersa]